MLDKTAAGGALGEVLGHRDGYVVKNKDLRERKRKEEFGEECIQIRWVFIMTLISIDLKVILKKLELRSSLCVCFIHDREGREKEPAQLCY